MRNSDTGFAANWKTIFQQMIVILQNAAVQGVFDRHYRVQGAVSFERVEDIGKAGVRLGLDAGS